MAIRAKTRTAGTLIATLWCAAATSAFATGAFATGALAQDAGNTSAINQVQLGDVFAGQTLHVDEAPNGANLAATAVGNSATAIGSAAAVDIQASQDVNGDVHAKTDIKVSDSAGPALYAVTSATGNTGTAGTCCAATTGNVDQRIEGNHAEIAESTAKIGGESGAVSIDSTAVGNDQGYEASNGSVTTNTLQTHLATIDAETHADVGAVDNTAGYSAASVANNVTIDAANSPVDATTGQQTTGFETKAVVGVTQGYAADAVAAATATSNNVNVTSDGYAALLANDQLNSNPVTAQSDLNIAYWDNGATSSAYGVANSAIVSNAGSYTGVDSTQNNTGAVVATANLNGGAGGDAVVSATGVGNAVSGYACASCNGVVRGNVTQTNAGGVSANATLTGGTVYSATGISSAIGNTATFSVQKPGG